MPKLAFHTQPHEVLPEFSMLLDEEFDDNVLLRDPDGLLLLLTDDPHHFNLE